MAMDSDMLADEIKAALDGMTDHNQTIPAMGDAIRAHIEDNCVVSYSWNGITVPPPPQPPVVDPTTSFDSDVTFSSFSISVPVTDNADIALIALGISISTAVKGATIVPQDPTFVLSPGTFLPALAVTLTKFGGTAEDAVESGYQLEALRHFSQEVVDGIINTGLNPIPLLGSHIAVPYPYLAPPGLGAIMTGIQ